MTVDRLRWGFWIGLMAAMALIAAASLVLWSVGDMADHGMKRTVAWAGVALLLLAFRYPRRRP